MSGWEGLWQSLVNILSEKIPEINKELENQKAMICSVYAMEKSLQHNKQRLFGQSQSAIMSHAAILLKKIGFRSIATSLYIAALYPKGTIGRAS
jgi:hypothetical protein